MSKSFFAASNSADGFKNYFDKIFCVADKLYIVKGGPGTGKSTLMRCVSERAEAKGFEVENYFCSSDHTSLDGVLVKTGDGYMGVIDGTPPHLYAEKAPGAVEEIINTGLFWNSEYLSENRGIIRNLCLEKSQAYANAYLYLRVCGELRRIYNAHAVKSCTDEVLKRIFEQVSDGTTGSEKNAGTPVLIDGIGMLGRWHFDTFEKIAERIYPISDCFAQRFFDYCIDRAKSFGVRIRICYNPIYYGETDGIYFEENRTWVVRGGMSKSEKSKYSEKIIFTELSDDLNLSRNEREECNHCLSMSEECIRRAEVWFAKAGEHHFSLEEIYKSAMDFDALGKYVDEFCKRLFE